MIVDEPHVVQIERFGLIASDARPIRNGNFGILKPPGGSESSACLDKG